MKKFTCILVPLLLVTVAGCSDPGLVITGPDTGDQTDLDETEIIDDGTSSPVEGTSDGDPWDDRKYTGHRSGEPVGPGPDRGQGE